MDNVLGVFDGGQESRHVVPELLRQFENIKKFDFSFFSPSFDVLPEEYHLIQFVLDFFCSQIFVSSLRSCNELFSTPL